MALLSWALYKLKVDKRDIFKTNIGREGQQPAWINWC